jgi:hypothetical protein
LVDQPCFFNFFNSILSLAPFSTILRVFFSSFPFFSLFKNVVRCHTIHLRGPVEMGKFWRSLLERPEFVDSQCPNKWHWQNLSILLKNLQIIYCKTWRVTWFLKPVETSFK